ncbi:putative D-glycerate permease [Anseongella ginsenosidimutans]|uniref:Putative D-glycerate permease n=1 Tax=Anseongella ginsenosidimutans TaxID=496056 RepID=A0A4R3KW46_9SPHI|nr:GntP family permease [Anseongella ginsenosidimutans]QEC51822.1 GntP family permease [Anseongella ginsenosidimutans]TCS89194.1 putative D-glycerate permease [Anseongella ginsenosidimutans]
MISGTALLLLIALAILFVVAASSIGKLHPFLALVLAALGLGFAVGMPADKILDTLTSGFGSITASIGLIIVFGTIIGVALEESGAAGRIAQSLVRVFGARRIVLAMSSVGGFVGIPVFCDSGFIILSKLARDLAAQTGKSAVSISVAMAGGLYTTHVLVPPTPGPLAAAANYGAESYLGQVILVGLLLSVPGVLTGYWWAVRSGRKYGQGRPAKEEGRAGMDGHAPGTGGHAPEPAAAGRPSLLLSLLPLLLPVLLIAGGSVAALLSAPGWLLFICKPVVALLIGVFASFFLFKKREGITLDDWIGKALSQAGPIILITAAGGAFGAVLKATPLNLMFESWIQGQNVSGIWLLPMVFLLAAGLKTSQGSSTAAIIITSSLVAPFLPALNFTGGLELGILVSVTGAGSMVVSHTNDSYFWVVSRFSGMSMPQTLRTFTMSTLLQGIAILISAIILLALFPG